MQLIPGPLVFHRPAKKAGLGTRLGTAHQFSDTHNVGSKRDAKTYDTVTALNSGCPTE